MTRMHLRVVRQLLIAIIVFLNSHEIEGWLSKREDEELEKQLKLLNKPAVKTVKSIYRDLYDCVDFYQQPGFDHPLLKNHTYHLDQIIKPVNSSRTGYYLKDGGCPVGTVPIRRITKEDLIRDRKKFKVNTSYAGAPSRFQFALAETPNDPSAEISEVISTMSIYNPKVKNNQWSAAIVKVENGRDQIKVGWRVDPILYGDTQTRLFISYKSGTKECFNTRCPGFVSVNPKIPLDKVFKVSSPPGTTIEETFAIRRDSKSQRWTLLIGRDFEIVGSWLPEVFTSLKGFATKAAWGGETFSAGPTFPPMGSSLFPPLRDTRIIAYCGQVSIRDSAGSTQDPSLQLFQSAPSLYEVVDVPNTREPFNHLVFYGGPGN